MNSPVEDRLREALLEAGATIDPGTLRPLRAPERRRFGVDFRLVAVAVAVVFAGAATAVGLGGHQGVDRVVATDPEPTQSGEVEMAVFLCTKSAPKRSCRGKNVTRDEVMAIERKVTGLPQVKEVFFVNQASAYAEFRIEYADNKTLLDSVKVTDMPPSFRLKLVEGADPRKVVQELGGMPGIRSVGEKAPTKPTPSWKAHISAFLCSKGSAMPACRGKAVTNAQRKAIRELIEGMPEVRSYFFEDQKTAYENFRHAYSDNKALIEATRVEDMPESFRLVLKRESKWAEVVGELKRQPGVSQVTYHTCLDVKAQLSERYGLFPPDNKVCPARK
ncbi:permease-like cell division protein FtsX [Nonomuraea sp. SYSU D8015]|uniref:permease-like cell division protein FtsX n=1 Tax=Nonomuraea sp. SYSU D8015 TaxID=2593644 RepID=UPI0016603FF8|nr:permease-like cell division protein FtsX [Nonomuraea sp. SYSU D8015]